MKEQKPIEEMIESKIMTWLYTGEFLKMVVGEMGIVFFCLDFMPSLDSFL
jgi:hypothetical protein